MQPGEKKFLIASLILLVLFGLYQYLSLTSQEANPDLLPPEPKVTRVPPRLTPEEEQMAKKTLSTVPPPLSKEEKEYADTVLSPKKEPPPLSPEEEAMRKQIIGF